LKGAPRQATGNGPGWTWTYTISAGSLSSKVNGALKDTSGKTVNVGDISDVQVILRDTDDPASHARTLRLIGSGGDAEGVGESPSARSSAALTFLSTLILTVNGDTGSVAAATLEAGAATVATAATAAGCCRASSNDVAQSPLPRRHLESGNGRAHGWVRERVVQARGQCLRAQFAKIAVSLYNLMHVDSQIAVPNVTIKPFDDVPIDSKTTGDISDWIAAAKSAGLVTG